MTWTISELKKKAVHAFTCNYWKCVLACFLLSFVGGVSNPSMGGNVSFNFSNSFPKEEKQEKYNYSNSNDDSSDYSFSNLNVTIQEDAVTVIPAKNVSTAATPKAMPTKAATPFGSDEIASLLLILGISMGIFFVIIAISMVFALAISIFVCMPFQVGGCHFFLDNAISCKASPLRILDVFKNNYKNTVITMFHKMIRVFLWSLLFIIPGIIKSYEYYMVPYIMADHPDMNYKDALELSRKMMDGEKWKTFVLELSFIGWSILSLFTFGILSILYVNPYFNQTKAELYLTLKESKCTPYQTYTGDTAYSATYSNQ